MPPLAVIMLRGVLSTRPRLKYNSSRWQASRYVPGILSAGSCTVRVCDETGLRQVAPSTMYFLAPDSCAALSFESALVMWITSRLAERLERLANCRRPNGRYRAASFSPSATRC